MILGVAAASGPAARADRRPHSRPASRGSWDASPAARRAAFARPRTGALPAWCRATQPSSRTARGARQRRAASVTEPPSPLLGEADDRLVAGGSADVVAGTQLGHREAVTLGVLHTRQSFGHGIGLQPGHQRPRGKGVAVQCRRSVNHVAGLLCKPCTRAIARAQRGPIGRLGGTDAHTERPRA